MMGASLSGLNMRSWGVSAAALLGVSFGLAAAIGPAEAEKVGVAAAVNPDAFSSLSGSPQSQLNIGKSIFFNERINTTTSGLVQVLLVDGSTFTVGPGSDLVIDKFVYDQKKKTGEIVATFSKGALRFVGGKISKNEDSVTVKTPAGALAIRGGVVQIGLQGGPRGIFSFIYGVAMTLGNHTVYEPGYTIDTTTGVPTVRPTTSADINAIMAALTGGGGTGSTTGNDPGSGNPAPQQTLAETLSLQDLIADATANKIDDEIHEQENAEAPDPVDPDPVDPPPPPPSDPVDPDPVDPPPPDPVDPPPPTPCDGCEGSPLGHLQGYAGGLYSQNTYDGEQDSPVGVLANWNSQHVGFKFNLNEDGTPADYFSAAFKLRVGVPGDNQGGIDINFGDTERNPDNPNSWINQYGFAAVSQPNGIKIFRDGQSEATLAEPLAALFSSGFFTNNNIAVTTSERNQNQNNGPPVDFCDIDCTFAEWGAFVAFASFEDTPDGWEGDDPFVRDVGVIGWWVVGDIPPVGQLPLTGGATYAGDAIATVSTDLFNNGWETYVATGDLNMTWNFGTRSGDLTISEFDVSHFPDNGGLTFSGPMCAPGVTSCGTTTPGGNHFGGPLNVAQPQSGPQLPSSVADLSGFALGSFARGPTNFDINGAAIKGSVPQGVIGNWGVGNDHYMASGIFAGSKVVPTQ